MFLWPLLINIAEQIAVTHTHTHRLSTMIFDVNFSTTLQIYFDSAHTEPVNFEHLRFVAATVAAAAQPIAPFDPPLHSDRHFLLLLPFLHIRKFSETVHQIRIGSTFVWRADENKGKILAIQFLLHYILYSSIYLVEKQYDERYDQIRQQSIVYSCLRATLFKRTAPNASHSQHNTITCALHKHTSCRALQLTFLIHV